MRPPRLTRFRSAILGALTGAHVASFLLVGVFTVFTTRSISAGATVPCFAKSECIDTAASSGGCSGDKCWEQGHGCPAGQGGCFVNTPPVNLAISIGRSDRVLDVGDYIARVYNYGAGVVILVAGVMFMVAGFQYLTSGAGGSTKAAKDRMRDAMIGLLLALGAYVILRTINPDVLKLQMPKIAVVKRSTFVQCRMTEMCHPCGAKYFALIRKSDRATATQPGQCEFSARDPVPAATTQQFEVGTECVGKSCSALTAQCGDDAHRCTTGDGMPPSECAAPSGGMPITPPSDGRVWFCKNCIPSGGPCNQTGSSDTCCGGFCNDQTGGDVCTNGQVGEVCDDNSECITNICQTNWLNRCSSGGTGVPCANNNECTGGRKCSTLGHNTCSPGTNFSYCDEDSECTGGRRCRSVSGTTMNVCLDASVTDPPTCSVSGCPSGMFCQTHGRDFCTDGSPGAPCAADSHCNVGPSGTAKGCATGANVCTAGALGDLCDGGGDCQSAKCGCTPGSGPFPTVCICVTGGPGSLCDDGSDCNTGLTCTSGRCLGSTAPAPAP